MVSLDVAGIVAGCKFRGEFEERMKNLLAEVDRLGDRLVGGLNIILLTTDYWRSIIFYLIYMRLVLSIYI